MAAQIVTPDDLKSFKTELLEDIRNIIETKYGTPQKKWLKSTEVRKLLNISPGTLQNFRINGTLPYTKMGGVLFYDYEDIKRILVDNRIDNT